MNSEQDALPGTGSSLTPPTHDSPHRRRGGESEQREPASRLSLLLAYLLKWRYQPERRGASWEKTVLAPRHEIAHGPPSHASIL
ncbi:DUF29 family protein [Candidatus Accumulibacter phosphatis]|uniref:DUF29 family protein n=1 Tax=Candidatus Accumulibacter contiguus TaxID=2954381 RepID=A0ABX1TDE0_9PROT|nr:DUF29 family protein [Candidatus Accumulibacter contiguus]